jgi:hypothetical protein
VLNGSRCDPRRAGSVPDAGEPGSDAMQFHHQKALLCADQRRSGMLGASRHGVKRARLRIGRSERVARDAVEHVAEQRRRGLGTAHGRVSTVEAFQGRCISRSVRSVTFSGMDTQGILAACAECVRSDRKSPTSATGDASSAPGPVAMHFVSGSFRRAAARASPSKQGSCHPTPCARSGARPSPRTRASFPLARTWVCTSSR